MHWNRCPEAKEALGDWTALIREAAAEPTSVHELVPGEPAFKGTLDAAKDSCGGVWLHGSEELAPILWRVKFPPEIAERLVSWKNPMGDITNSELEMAG